MFSQKNNKKPMRPSPQGSTLSHDKQQQAQLSARGNVYFGKRDSNGREDQSNTAQQQKSRTGNYFGSKADQSQNGLVAGSRDPRRRDSRVPATVHEVGGKGAAATAKNAGSKSRAGGTVPQAGKKGRGSEDDVIAAKGGAPSGAKARAHTDTKIKMNKQGVSPQSVDEARPGSHFGSYQRNGYESEHVAKVQNSRMTQKTTLDNALQAATAGEGSESSGRVASESETQTIESSDSDFIVGKQLQLHRYKKPVPVQTGGVVTQKQVKLPFGLKIRLEPTSAPPRVQHTGSSADAVEVGQEADLGEDSDEAHSQQAKQFQKRNNHFSEPGNGGGAATTLPPGRPRANDLGLKNFYSTFDHRSKARPQLDVNKKGQHIASDNGAVPTQDDLASPTEFKVDDAQVTDRSYAGSANSRASQVRAPGALLKQTNSFIVVPESDEVRRKPLATADFHRATNETSKGSNARNPAERAPSKIPMKRPRAAAAESQPIIEVVRPKRHAERSAPVDDGEQIEEHAISGPQVVAESLARGKRSPDVGDFKAGVPPTMRLETSAARRAKLNFIEPAKEDSLAYHRYCYVENSKKIDKQTDNTHSVAEAKQRLATQRKKCVKYNYALDDDIQNFPAYESYFCLTGVGEEDEDIELEIWNKKPIDNPKYVLEADPNRVTAMREAFENDLIVDEDDGLLADENFTEGVHFQYRKSSASCRLSDIKGIIFGGLSTRFWLSRKHMNSDYAYMAKNRRPAFYSWECVTLLLPMREIDLVVQKEQDMDDLLEVLVDALDTVDGGRGTAEIIKAAVQKQKFESEIENRARGGNARKPARPADLAKYAVTRQERQAIHKTTLKKYKVLRVRSKISFLAFKAKQTINELLLNQILKSYTLLTRAREIEPRSGYESFRHNDYLFMKLMKTGIGNIFKTIIQLNAEVLKEHAPRLYAKIKYEEAVEAVADVKQDSFVEVKDRFGMKTTKAVNYSENIVKATQLHGFLCAERAADMFNNVMTESGQAPQTQDHQLVRYNKTKERLTNLHNKCKILINMKAIRDLLFIKCALMKTQLAKELFVLEIEQSRESYIPNELAQDHLPMNFWYYDAILMFVQDLVSQETKDLHTFKNTFRLNFYQEENFHTKMMRLFGFSSSENKLTFKHQIVNEIASNVFTHSKSHHSKALQRSRYVMIDDDVARLQEHYQRTTRNLQEELQRLQVVSGGHNDIQQIQKKMRSNARNLILRYCCPAEINKMRQKLLIIKSSFLSKLQYLKALGRKNELMIKAESWIDANLEILYENYMVSLKNKKKKKRTLSYRETLFKDEIEAESAFQIKRQLKTKLLERLETLLKRRVQDARRRSIQTIKDRSRPSEEYQAKVRFIETSIEKDIRYLATRRINKQDIMKDLNNNQIKNQLDNISRNSDSLERAVLKDAEVTQSEITKSSIDIHNRSLKRQAQLENVSIEKARPDYFFENFKTEKVKLLKTRILENQQYLRHTVRIIKKDQEKYMQLLGFNKDGKEELNQMINSCHGNRDEPIQNGPIEEDDVEFIDMDEEVERLARNQEMKDREAEKRLLNDVIQQTFKDEEISTPAEGGEYSFIKVETYKRGEQLTLEDDEADHDEMEESLHNANSVMTGCLHGKEYKAPSMRGSFFGKTQMLDTNVFKGIRNQSVINTGLNEFACDQVQPPQRKESTHSRLSLFRKAQTLNLSQHLKLQGKKKGIDTPVTLNDVDLNLSDVTLGAEHGEGRQPSSKLHDAQAGKSVFQGLNLTNLSQYQRDQLRYRIKNNKN